MIDAIKPFVNLLISPPLPDLGEGCQRHREERWKVKVSHHQRNSYL